MQTKRYLGVTIAKAKDEDDLPEDEFTVTVMTNTPDEVFTWAHENIAREDMVSLVAFRESGRTYTFTAVFESLTAATYFKLRWYCV